MSRRFDVSKFDFSKKPDHDLLEEEFQEMAKAFQIEDDDGDDVVDKISETAVYYAPKEVVCKADFSFSKSAAYEKIPDEIYQKIKNHFYITFCEYGLQDVNLSFQSERHMQNYLRSDVGIERDIRYPSGSGVFRFVTTSVQESELENIKSDSDKSDDDDEKNCLKRISEVPEYYKAFMDSNTNDQLTSVIEDYCAVHIEFTHNPIRIISWCMDIVDKVS